MAIYTEAITARGNPSPRRSIKNTAWYAVKTQAQEPVTVSIQETIDTVGGKKAQAEFELEKSNWDQF